MWITLADKLDHLLFGKTTVTTKVENINNKVIDTIEPKSGQRLGLVTNFHTPRF